MSKERLEEIQKEVNYAYRRDGSISTKAVTMPIEHYEHLYEQSERVQELEGNRESDLWDLHKCERRLEGAYETIDEYEKDERKKLKTLNRTITRFSQQNKRYREAIDKIKKSLKEAHSSSDCVDIIFEIIEELEESE